MTNGTYLQYFFEHRCEYGTKIALVEIKELNKLPRIAKRLYDPIFPTWRMPHYVDMGVISWSWIRRSQDKENDFYTGRGKVGEYQYQFIPELLRRMQHDRLHFDIR